MLKNYIIVKKIRVEDLVKSLLCFNQTENLIVTVQKVTREKESNPEKIENLKLSVTNLSNYKNGKKLMEFKGTCITSRCRFNGIIRNRGVNGRYGMIELFPLTTVCSVDLNNGR